MGADTFFYPEAVDELIVASIDLALIYKCDPYTFLDRPGHEVRELYRLTRERLKEIKDE